MRTGVVGYGDSIHWVIQEALRKVQPDIGFVGVVDPDETTVRRRLDEHSLGRKVNS